MCGVRARGAPKWHLLKRTHPRESEDPVPWYFMSWKTLDSSFRGNDGIGAYAEVPSLITLMAFNVRG